MLGLSTGLVWDSGIKSLEEPPQDNLVGHWDFTDVTQLIGSLSGDFTGSILSSTDPIGRCKNKVTSSDRLGNWVRAIDNNKRPLWFTGGANGNAYAKFDNSGGAGYTQALLCRSTDSTNWGAVGTNQLSTTRLTAENISIFIVGEPLDDDTDGVIENVFSYFGYYDNPSGWDDSASVEFTFERDDDDDHHASWVLGDGVVSPNTINATNAANHWSSGGVSIINVQTSMDVSGSYIYTNNLPDVAQTIFYPASTGGFAQHAWADLDPVDYDDSKTASIGIGVKVDEDGEYANTATFEGKIYEILVYSASTLFTPPLSESDRAALTYYLGYKYNATINA
jgi:hypothetical protein